VADRKILPQIERTHGSEESAAVLGLHLEGPFINEGKYGAHNPALIRSTLGARELLDVYGVLDNVSIVTLAPELPGAEAAVRALASRGIVVSLGHSNATFAIGREAISWGASLVTHLFNAMKGFHHRDPGLVGLLGADDAPFASIIADGVHSHPASLKIAHAAHPTGLLLVTDAMMAMGLDVGRYQLGTLDVDVTEEGSFRRAMVHDTSVLAGSVATMEECVKKMRQYAHCSAVQALEAASLRPAQVLGLCPGKGTLDFGADADAVLLDDSLTVQATWVAGRLAWHRPQ